MQKRQKIAIVYDWIDKWGGVERVLLTLHEMFPQAEFYTSYHDLEKASWAKNLKIKTSFIQKFPSLIRESRIVSFPFYPYAFESMDFSTYDLVISVTSSFAKSIITRPDTLHICYLLTPTRYLWIYPEIYFQNKLTRALLSNYLAKLRKWDFVAAQRPDQIISISKTVADRCKKYYQRESEVIYPPFDVEYWNKIKSEIRKMSFRPKWRNLSQSSLELDSSTTKIIARNDKNSGFFLIVSRLELYKKVELLLQSINILKQNLIVVGEGSQLLTLKKIVGENVVYLNKITDRELGYLYSNAEALIMPQEEDFGYVSLEAQFFGCPVIAYKKGGATETISEGKTGIFFDEQSVNSLKSALIKYNMVKYELKNNTTNFDLENVEKYSKYKFKTKFSEYL